MSRDIKYIGMDVHKEAIVIAVLNSGRRWSWSPSAICTDGIPRRLSKFHS